MVLHGPQWLWPFTTLAMDLHGSVATTVEGHSRGLQGQTSTVMPMGLCGCGSHGPPLPIVAMEVYCRSWSWRPRTSMAVAFNSLGHGPPWLPCRGGLPWFFFFFSVIKNIKLQTMWGPHKQPSINNLTENLIEVSIYKCTKHGYQIY